MTLKYLINTKQDFEALLQCLRDEPLWSFDCETNGEFSRFKLNLVGLSFGFDLFSCYIPVNHRKGEQLPIDYVLDGLKPIFEDDSSHYVSHNAKFDEMVLSVYGIDAKGIDDDTFILAWLFSSARFESKGLKPLTKHHLGIAMNTYEDVIKDAKVKRGSQRDYNFANVNLDKALDYAADDAYFTLELQKIFYQKLDDEQLRSAYERIERPFIRVLRNMEARGVRLDRDRIEYADKALPEIREAVEAEIYAKAGRVFNLRSGRKIGKILFEEMQIGSNIPKTATGAYSTNKKTLELYADKNKFVANILRVKKIEKTHNTFVKGLKNAIEKDGRIHASFNQAGTITGRLSSSNPNLQNVETDEVEEIQVRDFFIPAEGYRFVVADLNQIELRVIAHFAKDEQMIDALTSGRDIHDEVARRMFKLNRRGTPRERLVAKTLNFGIPYGRGPVSISEQLKCSINEGKEFIAGWFSEFPKVLPYKKSVVTSAHRTGYVRTLSGRKRRLLPNIRSSDHKLRSSAERQAFNTKIQGSAADLIKAAMIYLEDPLKKFDAHMVIQVHDELVVETPSEKCDSTVRLMKRIMEHPLEGRNPLRLPIVTKLKVVDRWSDAK